MVRNLVALVGTPAFALRVSEYAYRAWRSAVHVLELKGDSNSSFRAHSTFAGFQLAPGHYDTAIELNP
jgi:hypothetical protein